MPALDGIRVLDFTAAMAGPRCGMPLGDFGADVIKIEPPAGDHARRLREHPGLDMLMQAYAAHMSVTGEPGRPSIRNGPSPIDLEALCRVIGRDDLVRDARFRSNADRITNRAALHDELFPIFRSRAAEEWVTLLAAAGIPASLVEDLAGVTRQEQLAAWDLLLPTGIDDVATIGIALKMELTPGALRRPPPELGADTEPVLAELETAERE